MTPDIDSFNDRYADDAAYIIGRLSSLKECGDLGTECILEQIADIVARYEKKTGKISAGTPDPRD